VLNTGPDLKRTLPSGIRPFLRSGGKSSTHGLVKSLDLTLYFLSLRGYPRTPSFESKPTNTSTKQLRAATFLTELEASHLPERDSAPAKQTQPALISFLSTGFLLGSAHVFVLS